MMGINGAIFGYVISAYAIVLIACAGRFAYMAKTPEDSYDLFDYFAMILMSPVFIVHKTVIWIKVNWVWLLTEAIPTVVKKLCTGILKLYKWFVRPLEYLINLIQMVTNLLYDKLYKTLMMVIELIQIQIKWILHKTYIILNKFAIFVLQNIRCMIRCMIRNFAKYIYPIAKKFAKFFLEIIQKSYLEIVKMCYR